MFQAAPNDNKQAAQQPPQAQDDNSNNNNNNNDMMDEWVDATLKTAQSLNPAAYLPELFWRHQTRPDGRIFGQARPTTIATSVLKQNTLGSALVRLVMASAPSPASTTKPTNNAAAAATTTTKATTHVLAGITADIGQPSSQPLEGDLRVTLVPSGDAALESWLERLLQKCLDLSQLGIVPGKSAFGLHITLAVLNHDGNRRDACLLAAVAALLDTTLPAIVVQEGGRVFTLSDDADVDQVPQKLVSHASKKLIVGVIPVPLSMGSMSLSHKNDDDSGDNNSDDDDEEPPSSPPPQHHWLVDPSREEESVCEGSVSVVVNALDTNQVLSLDYQGRVSVTPASLALAVRMAVGRAEELLPLLIPE